MTSNEPIKRVAPRRRQTLSLPKRRHHLSLAVVALIILVASPMILAKVFGNDTDAEPKGSVTVVSLPPGERLSPLDERGEFLPDLLASSVALGDNPTDALAARDRVDALGNAVNAPTPAPTPTPKTLLIPPQPKAPPLDVSLTRQSRFGLIPGPNKDGKTPLDAYRIAQPSLGGRTPVSIIIGGLGINTPLTERAINELPPAVTLSFAPQTPDLQSWVNKARARGHEVLLELPMEGETFDPTSSGTERTLRPSLSVEDNRRHLNFLLSRAQGYAGVINYQGQVLLRRSDATSPILTELKASGLGFFMDGSFDAPSVTALAQSVSLPFKASFGLIDPTANTTIINARLDNLANAAKTSPGAVGVGFVYPQTIDAVKGWTATLSSQGLILVPATAALK